MEKRGSNVTYLSPQIARQSSTNVLGAIVLDLGAIKTRNAISKGVFETLGI
jgi:hypothetical protein